MQTLQLVILFVLFIFTVWLFFLDSRANHPLWAMLEHRRYAHRGLHDSAGGVPENSLAAFRRAVRRGYGAELDVHLLRDGTLAVFHDSDLRRMTGHDGVIEDCAAADLAALRLAGTAETIPQLCEVLSLYEGTGLSLVIELKSHHGNHRALAERTAKELDKFHVPYCIESFDPRCLMWLRAFRPEIIRGQLSENFRKDARGWEHFAGFLLSNLLLNASTAPDFISYKFEDRRRFAPRICRAFYGAHMFYWTVRSRADMEAAEREGAQVIFEGFDPSEAEKKSERKEDRP
ncbi:glycerophosphodiester phosphodiesterase [Oscillibacter valericigenes]|nr:glycerophosphodiester phosphodiesterase [Oscillibacter valericigenes]